MWFKMADLNFQPVRHEHKELGMPQAQFSRALGVAHAVSHVIEGNR